MPISPHAARAPPLACTTTVRPKTFIELAMLKPGMSSLIHATPFASEVYLTGIHGSVCPASK